MTARAEPLSHNERSALDSLISRFGSENAAVEVNFRHLMPSATQPRGGHAIHPYPAKLLVNIPQFFLAALSPDSGSKLLDPFCGSGTVLYEAALAGLRPFGSDSNPLARLVTRAKLTPIDRDVVSEELALIMQRYPLLAPDIPDVVNRDYWFSDRISQTLGKLRAAIAQCVSPRHRPLFDASFSATVKRVSYADPRLSVPVKINPARSARYGAKGDEVLRRLKRLESVDVAAVFWSIVNQNSRRLRQVREGDVGNPVTIFDDARALSLADASIDIAITSPPYVGAQKYIRASSLSLGWLGFTPECKLRPHERVSIGREHLGAEETWQADGTSIPAADALLDEIAARNPLRARIAQRYLLEMRDALAELARVMRTGAHLVLVVGPNLVAGLEFPTPAFLEQMAWRAGFATQLHLIDSIDSRGLMTKRNRTAGVIQQESVFLLKRRPIDA
jgi:DNA modification methylase